ncbi:zinc finger protein ZFAT-like isoform X1 [Limulus polyphemus]|uniref:Zinc finger protein ZFAT-like isoform X1 n=2 Tax=Limulus polyphemus TaxID=6850 RepID=A0ABM1SYH7_LIMPO|nr:zinc finger protein ZFAT-like isoform X1 [Limulus polyphemus]
MGLTITIGCRSAKSLRKMDVFICGICQEEFHDIEKFVDHKKTLGTITCDECKTHFHTQDKWNQHVLEKHQHQLDFEKEAISLNPGVQAEPKQPENQTVEEERTTGSVIQDAVETCVTGLTVEELEGVTFLPDPNGNITLMGNIQIVQPGSNESEVLALTQCPSQEGLENGTSQMILTLPEQCTAISSNVSLSRNPTMSLESFTTLNSGNEVMTLEEENPNRSLITTASCAEVKGNFQSIKNNQPGDIFACSICHCFSLCEKEIIKHLQDIHNELVTSGSPESLQFISRLAPLACSNASVTQVDVDSGTKVREKLSFTPVDTTSSVNTTSVRLYLEPFSESSQTQDGPPVKRRRGRPRKSEQQKSTDLLQPTQSEKSPDPPAPPQPGPDGRYSCTKCQRSFTKERHLLGHKCLGVGDYIDPLVKIEEKEDNKEKTTGPNDLLAGNDEVCKEEDDDEVDTDLTADFTISSVIDNPPWSRGGNRKRGRGRGRGRSNRRRINREFMTEKCILETENEEQTHLSHFSSILVEDPMAVDEKPKRNWREDPFHVPIFNSKEEQAEFEEKVNAVDLSCVDDMFVRHEVSQEVNTELTGRPKRRENNELIVFSCNVCKKVIKSLSHIRLHCVTHTNLKPFKCLQCPSAFNAKGNLYTHMRKHTGNYFRCPKCDFYSCNRSHLAEHEAIHNNTRYKCKLCHNDYNTIKSLINHIRKYHQGPSGKQYLALFQTQADRNMSVLHVCNICNRKFKKKIDRDRHLYVHDIRDNTSFMQCSLCDYIASRRSYLENHHRKHRIVYVCSVCESMFLSSVLLKNHFSHHKLDSQCNDKTYLNPQHPQDQETTKESQQVTQTLDQLFEESINKSWYLPEPRGSIAQNQYVNIPLELCEDDNQVTAVTEGDRKPSFSLHVSLNYKLLTTDLYSKIQEAFGKVECQHCGKLFHTVMDLDPHLLTHEENKPFKCTKCSYSAVSKDCLKRHQETVHEKMPFPCEFCEFVAPSRTSLWHHRQKHLISQSKCPVCDTEFQNFRLLKSHVILKHPGMDRNELRKLLGTNKKVTGRLGRRSYKCPYCDRIFHRSSTDLQKHMWIHEGIKPYKCTLCSHESRSKNNLRVHMLRHTEEKSHLCEECGKSYKSKTALRTHLKIHTQGNIFTCDRCDYSASQKSHLWRHMETHDVVRQYACEHCDYSSNTVGYMKAHYSRHHKGAIYNENSSFSTPEILENQEQVFKCVSCSYIFGNISDLKRHLRVRHGLSVDKVEFTVSEEPLQVTLNNNPELQTHADSNEVMPEESSVPRHVQMVECEQPAYGEEEQKLHLNLPDGELDERTASALHIIQQVFQQGALNSHVTVEAVDGENLVTLNPDTIIVQNGDGELVFNGDTGGQYVIQYVTDLSQMCEDNFIVTQGNSKSDSISHTNVAPDSCELYTSISDENKGFSELQSQAFTVAENT